MGLGWLALPPQHNFKGAGGCSPRLLGEGVDLHFCERCLSRSHCYLQPLDVVMDVSLKPARIQEDSTQSCVDTEGKAPVMGEQIEEAARNQGTFG